MAPEFLLYPHNAVFSKLLYIWQETAKRASILPKTFKIPVDESYGDKKHKKSKKSREKEKEKQPSSTLPTKSAPPPDIPFKDIGEEIHLAKVTRSGRFIR